MQLLKKILVPILKRTLSFHDFSEPSAPRMKDTNLGGNVKIERKLGDSLELKCVSEAIPKATIDWYKDEIKIATNASNLSMDSLIIPYIRPEDEGQYKCVVSNRLGVIEESVIVKITSRY